MCVFRALRSDGTKQNPGTDVQHRLDCLLKYFFNDFFLKPHYSFTIKFASKLNLRISHIYFHHKNEYI